MAYSHFMAHCTGCTWRTEDNILGPYEAEKHITETGHQVLFETAGRAGPEIMNELVSIHMESEVK